MKKIDWKRKLSSRKFWALIGALALCVGVIFGVDDITIEQVVALIGAMGGVVAYILGESYVDGKHVDDILQGIEVKNEEDQG